MPPFTPTDLLLDGPPPWSIFDIASPVTDLPGIESQADWTAGVRLHYRTDQAFRKEMASFFDGSDPAIAGVADPAEWAAAVTITAGEEQILIVDAGTNEVQAWTSDATGGTYTLSWDGEGPTAPIPFDATDAQVQAALETLANIDPGDVEVGQPGANRIVVFKGQYEVTNVPTITVDNTLMTGGTGGFAVSAPGVVPGTFTLTFDGVGPTAAIAGNASAAAVQAALETLANIDPGDVTVSGGPGGRFAGAQEIVTVDQRPYVIRFAGQYIGVDVPTIVVDDALLTGANGAALLVEAQAGAGTVLASYPQGLKELGADADVIAFRPFFVHTSRVVYELYQQLNDAGQDAETVLKAHIARQVSAELADSLFTKNPGLMRTAVDVSNASAVDPVVAVATLYEAFNAAGGNGDATLHVPYHAVPFLVRRRLAEWRGGRLLDCYGNPIHITPLDGTGPYTDPDDLSTGQVPDDGEGWLYLSPRIYVSVTAPAPRLDGEPISPTGRAPYAKANEEFGFAEAVAIAVFKPVRTFAINTVLNSGI